MLLVKLACVLPFILAVFAAQVHQQVGEEGPDCQYIMEKISAFCQEQLEEDAPLPNVAAHSLEKALEALGTCDATPGFFVSIAKDIRTLLEAGKTHFENQESLVSLLGESEFVTYLAYHLLKDGKSAEKGVMLSLAYLMVLEKPTPELQDLISKVFAGFEPVASKDGSEHRAETEDPVLSVPPRSGVLKIAVRIIVVALVVGVGVALTIALFRRTRRADNYDMN